MKIAIYILVAILLSACTNNPGKTKEEKIAYLLQKSFEDGDFVGNVLIAEHGKVIYKGSFGKLNTDTTKFPVASISKPITAVLILRLIDKKIITLEDRVSKYYKLSDSRVGSITVHQLLTHTSRINEFIDKQQNMILSSVLEKATLNGEPGSSFEYSNAGYVLLKGIAEVATQKPYPQLVHEEVFAPAGMTHSGVARNVRANTFAKGYVDAGQSQEVAIDFPLENVDGAGSIYSTVDDLYELDRALYSEVLLSNAMKEKMLTQHVPEKYSYGWYVKERSGVWDVYWHKGNLPGYTTYITRRVQKDQFIVLLANAGNLDLSDLENSITKILKAPS